MQRRESRFSPFFLSSREKPLPAPAFPCALPGGYGSSAGGSAVFTLLLTENEVYIRLKQTFCLPETEPLFR
ncbi:hypothetical protein [Bacteroides xylanisolvens]|uniref:hypothetical protein n=1 Tax=Bacteroides xylanisolvens TaxID=371601 RepID=UPI001F5A587D|nr:hypothetical protein [Bacteroides xylanisolvens]